MTGRQHVVGFAGKGGMAHVMRWGTVLEVWRRVGPEQYVRVCTCSHESDACKVAQCVAQRVPYGEA